MPLHSLLAQTQHPAVTRLLMVVVLMALGHLTGSRAHGQQPPADAFASAIELLPDTTGGLARVTNLPALLEAWQKTSLARLADDPSMQPFWETQRQEAEQQMQQIGLKLGLRWSDLKQMVSGEVVVAWMTFPEPKRPYAVAMIADVRQRAAQVDAALQRLDRDLKAKGATRADTPHDGHTVRVYTMPRSPGQLKIERIALAATDQRLIAADREVVVTSLLDAAAGQSPDAGLAAAKDYQAVRQRLPQPQPSDVQWFGRPLQLALIIRELADTDRGQRVDVVKLLASQGFDALIAAGGQVSVAQKGFDLLHHGFIWAPPTTEEPSRYELAARMLQFPNTAPEPFPAWISPDSASCLRLNWKMEEAFWAAETLVDEAFGDKIFRPTLEGIREDEEGPQIDIAGDIVANFGDHLILVTDNTLPASLDSERSLIAIRLKNAGVVQRAVQKAMESEPDASLLKESPDHPIWEVLPQDAATDFDDDIFNELGFDTAPAQQPARQPPLLERWAITVAGDYLMFSSHPSLLLETVRRANGPAPANTFESQPEVQQVLDVLQQVGGPQRALGRVVLTQRAARIKYELLRQGKLRESDSVLAALIRRVFDDSKRADDPQAAGLAQLPPFAQIADYLHPAGSLMKTEPEGWSTASFLLSDKAAEATAPADAPADAPEAPTAEAAEE